MIDFDDAVPVLLATASADERTWKVWCPHCKRDHIHSPEAGYRYAHCYDDTSPYEGTGYYIKLR